MPRKAKRPCRVRGCPELTELPSGYCAEHEKQMWQEWQAKRKANYVRPPEYNKRYDRHWREIRKAFLVRNPLCEMCKRQGKYTAAQEVHHIKALADGGDNRMSNLMALCKSCHSKITYAENNRGGGSQWQKTEQCAAEQERAQVKSESH